MAKVTMPQLGESVAEGTIGKWLKKPGDTVAKYEPLLEVITDKVNAEVPSPFAGVLREILAQEGATVPNNAEIAVIETEDEALVRRHRGPPRSFYTCAAATYLPAETGVTLGPAGARTSAPAVAGASRRRVAVARRRLPSPSVAPALQAVATAAPSCRSPTTIPTPG